MPVSVNYSSCDPCCLLSSLIIESDFHVTNYVHALMSTIRDFCPFFRNESEASNLENAKRSPLIK